jgi:glycerophosphoryl diester phosphodiesterase
VGADAVETDVRLTRDGVVVCLHDETVDRTTDGSGRVDDLPLEALERLDAGARFTPDGGQTFPWRGRSVRVPTLATCFRALPELPFNVELKTAEPRLVEGVLDLVAVAGRASTTLLSSFSEEALDLARASARRRGLDVAIGACEEESRRSVELLVLQVPTHAEGRAVLFPDLVRRAHARGVRVYAWTVNELEEARAWLDAGLDALVTDVPERFVPLFRAWRAARAP